MSSRSAEQSRVTRVETIIEHLRHMLERFPPEEIDAINRRLEQIGQGDRPPPAKADLLRRLGGRGYSGEERLHLEILSLLEVFRNRRELLRDSLTASQVAQLLDSTRQTPYDRAKNGSLLAVSDGGAFRFPIWQFDADGDHGVIPGLSQVARKLRLSPVGKIGWMVRPNPQLDGATPLSTLKAGQVERVVNLAQSAGRI